MKIPALAASVALASLFHAAADARVTRLVVERTETVAPARPGAPVYRILHGHYDGELDPGHVANRIITDIDNAPRDAGGLVGYSATFAIALPVDAAQASGFLMYDVPNRGNGAVAADADGHVRVISGWQGDITAPDAQRATVPVARAPGDVALTAPVLQRFTDIPAGVASIAITGGIVRPTPRPEPVSLDTRRARLYHQAGDQAAPIDVAPDDWAFADCRASAFPGQPDPAQLCL
ncbi:hypothetical protein, partial [Sphingomonas sp.]|uniref:hypothetical protein n=1 Tax=Sphingomonas sp. TaxID=28214 RepID=UPI003B3A09A4